MSQLLDSAAQLDAVRAADLLANDEARRAWEESDRAYLQRKEAEAARRMLELMALEASYHNRMGWI
jgi:hypothetical protein